MLGETRLAVPKTEEIAKALGLPMEGKRIVVGVYAVRRWRDGDIELCEIASDAPSVVAELAATEAASAEAMPEPAIEAPIEGLPTTNEQPRGRRRSDG
jgi:hypothetical protein